MPILDYFPLGQPRQGQIDALTFIEESVWHGFKDIVIEAPTGVGKSAIGACASFWMNAEVDCGSDAKAYYLVTQKLLQKQLEDDMIRYQPVCGGGKLIKSATDYDCAYHKNCGAGGRTKGGCINKRTGTCKYTMAKQAFLSSSFGVTNYSYFFSEREYVGDLASRGLLVLDECHNLEDQIIKHAEGTVSSDMVKRWDPTMELPDFDDCDQYIAWLKTTYLPMLGEFVRALSDLLDTPDDKSKDLVDADSHMCKLHRAVSLCESGTGKWIFWQDVSKDSDKKPIKTCFLRALKAGPFYQDMIGKASPVRLHLSAYPGAKDIYCESLGLKPSQVAWMKLPSTFKPENRRVVAYDIGSMASGARKETLPLLLKTIKTICDNKPTRGLIHCGTYEIGEWIYNYLQTTEHADRARFPKKADDRDDAVLAHAKNEGSILISPSMMEGFDFKDDLCRWQVVAKVPYLYLGDRQIAARAAMNDDWYKMRAVMSIIQESGRICRSESDSGITYILDSDFLKLYSSSKRMFPTWWTEAVTLK